MKLNNLVEANEFLKIARECEGRVELRSRLGDVYNLKSHFMTYIVIGKMLQEKAEDLELFCESKRDEERFFKLFNEGKLNP